MLGSLTLALRKRERQRKQHVEIRSIRLATKCPSAFLADLNAVTLSENDRSLPDPFRLPLGAQGGHDEWEQPAADARHSPCPVRCHARLVCFFLLAKTDDAQLILASAVIPMPGACVFPTTTSRSSAAAAAAAATAAAAAAADGDGDGSGRGSTQKFKGDCQFQRGTRGSPSFPPHPV